MNIRVIISYLTLFRINYRLFIIPSAEALVISGSLPANLASNIYLSLYTFSDVDISLRVIPITMLWPLLPPALGIFADSYVKSYCCYEASQSTIVICFFCYNYLSSVIKEYCIGVDVIKWADSRYDPISLFNIGEDYGDSRPFDTAPAAL